MFTDTDYLFFAMLFAISRSFFLYLRIIILVFSYHYSLLVLRLFIHPLTAFL